MSWSNGFANRAPQSPVRYLEAKSPISPRTWGQRLGVIGLTLIFILSGLAVGVSAEQAASDKIKNFDSEITVGRDGSLYVTETIQLVAGLGNSRGINRDFPTIYRDKNGKGVRIDFHLLSVERDGQPESYYIERSLNGLRVILGQQDTTLVPGKHTFVLKYKVSRVLGFHDDRVELFWNVTGQPWSLAIERASATVILPGELTAEQVSTAAFTGVQGEASQDFAVVRKDPCTTHFVVTRALEPGEGLSILITWPKGVVQQPDFWQRLDWFSRDNRGASAIMFGLLLVLVWYLVAWNLVGRDPRKGMILPVFSPPEGVSPAAMRYVMNMGYDKLTFLAAMLSLAVKGHIHIRQEGKTFFLSRQESQKPLSAEESAITECLPQEEFRLGSEHKTSLSKAIGECRRALAFTNKGEYFATNQRWLIPGLVLSAVFAAIGLAVTVLDGKIMVLPGSIGLLIWSLGTLGLVYVSSDSWRRGRRKVALALGILSLVAILGWFAGLVVMARYGFVAPAFLLVALALLNLLFSGLIKAPTAKGRQLMDQIEGFRMHLRMTEADYLKWASPPALTVELFYSYLPSAMALDIEHPWAEQFAKVFEDQAGEGGSPVNPSWYDGPLPAQGPIVFVSALSSAFSHAISSASHCFGFVRAGQR